MVLVQRALIFFDVLLDLTYGRIRKVGGYYLHPLDTTITRCTGHRFHKSARCASVVVPIRLAIERTTVLAIGSLLNVGHLMPLGLITEHLFSVGALHKQLVNVENVLIKPARTPVGAKANVRDRTIRCWARTIADEHFILIAVIPINPDLYFLASTARSDVVLAIKLTVIAFRVDEWAHVDCELTILIDRGLVDWRGNCWVVPRGSAARLFKPLRVYSRALEILADSRTSCWQRLSVTCGLPSCTASCRVRRARVLVVNHCGTRNCFLAPYYTRGVDRAVRIGTIVHRVSLRISRSFRTNNGSRLVLRKRYRLRKWRNERKGQCCSSDRSSTTSLELASHKHSFHWSSHRNHAVRPEPAKSPQNSRSRGRAVVR